MRARKSFGFNWLWIGRSMLGMWLEALSRTSPALANTDPILQTNPGA
jgi:hypothetical protein